MDVQAAIAELHATPIGIITDVLTKLGVRGLTAGLRPLRGFEDRRITGTATTLRFLPARGVGKSGRSAFEVIYHTLPGSVIVIDGHGADYVFMGDNMARLAKNRGAVGVVIDGLARDLAGIRAADIPIFARGTGVRLNQGAWDLVDSDVPVAVGGVQVHPGDIIAADEDGVVVVPHEVLDRVIELVREAIPLEAEFDRIIREDRPLEEIRDIIARRRAARR